MEKTCTKCQESKLISLFGSDKRYLDGKRPHCNQCRASDEKVRRHKSGFQRPPRRPGEGYAHPRWIRRKYGLSLEEYNEQLDAQGHVCAICHGINASGRKLAVDHCHKTGAVRGLLCSKCNSALGYLNDDPQHVAAALEYLKWHGT
jgi:hypothetical protein